MSSERLRERAHLCLKFAAASGDPEIATRLKILAGEYLMAAERAEGAPGTAEIADEPAAAARSAHRR
jgi:hypothetical protein